MARPRVSAAGGLRALSYVFARARESGGLWNLYRRMRSRNTCKTCAIGMGGRSGGMVNEAGGFPEVCKKSIQAQAGDMGQTITERFLETTPISRLGSMSSAQLEKLGRLTFPILAERDGTHFRRIAWDEAIRRTTAALKSTPPDESFFYASGRSSNEAAFLLQLFARAFGCSNIHNCSSYCHAASGVALGHVYGSGTSSVQLDDLYIQPHVGGDIPLLKALLKGVIERQGIDREYVEAYTSGWAELEADIAASTWEELLERSGVERPVVDRAVDLLLEARRGIFLWAMGLTHHLHGVDNILALCNLALARSWLGRPGAGLLPIRGHSNVQGVGSVGVSPMLKKAFADRIEDLYGIEIERSPGLDTYGSMEAAMNGRIQTAVLLGGNLFASNPDREWASRALRKIGFTSYLTTKLNEGHIHGRGVESVILPVLARDEESQSTTQESMFNFVRLSEGGPPAVEGEMRSEVEIIASLAQALLEPGRYDWSRLRSHRELRRAMSRSVPGYGAIEEIDRDGGEFQIEGRTFHQPRFSTPDGRARFHVTPLPKFRAAPGEFRLMTLRSEGQFNTVVYEEEDLYRGNRRRDVVMMSPIDARRMKIDEGDPVRVTTGTGSLDVIAALVDIPAGNLAMYYPEANQLVPRDVDPTTGTPAFKSILARLLPIAPDR